MAFTVISVCVWYPGINVEGWGHCCSYNVVLICWKNTKLKVNQSSLKLTKKIYSKYFNTPLKINNKTFSKGLWNKKNMLIVQEQQIS